MMWVCEWWGYRCARAIGEFGGLLWPGGLYGDAVVVLWVFVAVVAVVSVLVEVSVVSELLSYALMRFCLPVS